MHTDNASWDVDLRTIMYVEVILLFATKDSCGIICKHMSELIIINGEHEKR